jgi:chromosome segregation ATPase
MSKADELQQQIKDAEHIRKIAIGKITALKKQILLIESDLIESNLIIEKATAALQSYNDSIVYADVSEKSLEIEIYRKRFPEICALAKQRDLKGDKDGTGNNS